MGFDLQQASELATKCRQVYYYERDHRAIGDGHHIRARGGAEAAVWERDGVRTVVVNGTYHLLDVFQDLRILLPAWWRELPPGSGLIHRGMRSQAKALLWHLITIERERPMPTRLAGHSLGGAGAQLLAAALRTRRAEVVGVYTFGAPRVGSTKFSNWYGQHLGQITWRVVMQGDPVPRVPKSRLLGRQIRQHAGRPVILRPAGWVTHGEQAWQAERAKQVISWRDSWRIWKALSELRGRHSIALYCEALDEQEV